MTKRNKENSIEVLGPTGLAKMMLCMLGSFVVVLAFCADCPAEAEKKTPETKPAAAEKAKPAAEKTAAEQAGTKISGQALQVTVVSVKGQVEKLQVGKKDKWEAVAVGEKLDEMTVIRTGLRSQVVLKLEDRGQLTIDRNTKVGIGEFRKEGKLVRTRLGLKYGIMHVTVDSSRGPNDAQVQTPTATLSVRGSRAVIAHTGDRGLGLQGQAGTWRVAVGNRTRNVTPGEATDGALTPSIILATANRSTRLGDSFGLTIQESIARDLNPSSRSPATGITTRGSATDTGTNLTPQVPPQVISPPSDHIIIGI